MRLSLTLAGLDAEWDLRDAAALDAWLRSRPWVERGGVRVVRVAGSHVPSVAAAIEGAAFGHDGGTSGLRLRRVLVEDLSDGLRAGVARTLGISPNGSARETAERMARVVQEAPVLLVVEPCQDAHRPRVVSEAEDLLELLEKLRGVLLAMALLDAGPNILAGSAFDLSQGLPRLIVTSIDDDMACWRAYLHQRLAWECGGDVAQALAFDSVGFGDLRTGDDAALEALLNRAAYTTFDALPIPTREQFLKYLRGFSGKAPRTRPPEVEARLADAGLLWCPLGERGFRPTPWAARAAMRTESSGPARFLLRGSLVCTPLSRDLLFRCFNLEARERTAWWSSRPPGASLSTTTSEIWARFQAGAPGSAALYYPPDCPARPINAWDLASFGEIVRIMQPDARKAPALYEVSELRNALAHGHYASWASVVQLRNIERQLDG